MNISILGKVRYCGVKAPYLSLPKNLSALKPIAAVMALVFSCTAAKALDGISLAAEKDEDESLSSHKWLSLHAYADIETAYVSRGIVWDSRPYSAQYAEGDLHLGPFGRAEAYAWSASALSGEGHSTSMRYAYNEVDWGIRYAWDIEFSQDWKLTSGAAKQWVTCPGVRHNAHSLIDWQAFQVFENPYVTPYWRMRYFRRPYQALYWCVGLKKGFELAQNLIFTIDLFGDIGDARHYRNVFGPKPGHESSNYHGGMHAINLVLRLDYQLTEFLGLYAFAGQYCLVSEDAREAVKAMNTQEAKRDLTFAGVGLKLDF